MDATGLFHNRRFNLAAITMAALLAVIFTSEILTAGRPDTALSISDTASVLCALIAAVLFVWAWRKMNNQEVSKRVWGLVTLGIVLWTLAEALWTFYEQVLGIETPYPSIADLFWLAGYVPLFAALLIRYRSFQSTASAVQRWIVRLFMVLYSGLLILYVVKPILDAFDTSKLAESLTNVAYPLADWGLCLLTLAIIFSLERGRFASVWHLFGSGILLMATADLIFFYASWNELYYPGGQLNLVSGLIDGLFNMSYLLMGLSIYAYVILAEANPPAGINLVLSTLAKMEVLIFVNPEGHILSLSDNFMNLVHAAATKPYVGMGLAKALGIDGPGEKELLARIVERGSLSNYPVRVRGTDGQSKNAWLTSLIMINEEARLDSIALVLRADPPPSGETEIPLHEDQRMLIDYYLEKTGTSRIEENEALRAYFVAQVNLLYSLVKQYSGSKVADRMLDHLSQTARLNDWQFSRNGREISIPDDVGGQAL